MGVPIRIKNLYKRYGKVIAVDHLSLEVDSGDFVVLLGPSGCGKTTLLRCIAGLEEPEEGEIIINGKVVFSSSKGISLPPGKRRLGMVFQSYALWPHMTVYENVVYGLKINKMPPEKIRQRAEEVLNAVSMQNLGNRYPSELSGGQQQRVALARLIATDPPIFLMDEPLSNLDARLRMDMRAEIKRLQYEKGSTTLYVTHDQIEALTMATKVVVMNNGKIEQIGSPQEVYHLPANLFVAEFIGVPTINLIPAKIINDGANRYYIEGGGWHFPISWDSEPMDVILAVRPEDLRIAEEAETNTAPYKIYDIQPTGPETIVYLKNQNMTLVLRDNQYSSCSIDQTVWVEINTKSINLFDKEVGKLIIQEGKKQK